MALCACGCGQTTPAATKTRSARGIFKGQPLRYVPGHYRDVMQRKTGANSLGWKGGRSINTQGYVMIYSPDHPNRNAAKCVREHRLVMESHLGRLLLPGETVHHKNGNRADNRLENLELRAGAHGPGLTHCPRCGASLY